MMKKTSMLVFLLLMVAGWTTTAIARDDDDLQELRSGRNANEWNLIKKDSLHNIRTYGKQEEGKRMRSFRIEALLDASLETVARVHFDIDNIKKWFYETRESRLLKRVSSTEYYYYCRYGAPATLPDRDVILRAVVEPYTPKKGFLLVRLNAVPDYLPPTPGLVRMVAQEQIMKFTPQGPDKTLLEVEGYIDPGGSVPVWAINFVQRRAPYSSMVGMMRMLQMPQYRVSNSPLPFTFIQYAADR